MVELPERVGAGPREMPGSATLPGVDEIRMPGTNSWRIFQDRKANGIPITAPLLEKLDPQPADSSGGRQLALRNHLLPRPMLRLARYVNPF